MPSSRPAPDTTQNTLNPKRNRPSRRSRWDPHASSGHSTRTSEPWQHQEVRSPTGRPFQVSVSANTANCLQTILTAARDFIGQRADMWPDVHVEYLQVHEVADSHAEVTEGNPWPIGYVRERLHYDWFDSHAVIDERVWEGPQSGPPRTIGSYVSRRERGIPATANLNCRRTLQERNRSGSEIRGQVLQAGRLRPWHW